MVDHPGVVASPRNRSLDELPGARRRLLVLGLLAPFYTAPALAAQVDYGVGYAGERSSNIRRVATNPEHEWSNSLIGGFTYGEDSPEFTGRATFQGEYRNYVHDTLPDESLFLADVAAVWTLSPRRLTWTLQDAFREVSVDPTAAPTTVNLAGANVFSTGPDMYLHFGPVHSVALGARYGNMYVGEQDIDNSRYTGLIRWLYQSSPNTTWSLNYELLRVVYDNDVLNENYRRRDAFFRLEKRYVRSLFTVDLGATTIERERSSDIDGSLARVSWRRELSTDSSFGLGVTTGYQDLGSQLQGLVTDPTIPIGGLPGAPIGTQSVTNDLYYLKQADAFYTRRGAHLGWTVRAVGREYDFEVRPEDRDETGGGFEASYFYSVTTTYTLFGDFLKTKYLQIDRRDEDKQVGVRVNYLVRRNVTLGLEARRTERGSTVPASEFVDTQFLITLFYSTGPLYGPVVR